MATFRCVEQLSPLSSFILVALHVFGSIGQGSGSRDQPSSLVAACLKEKNCWLNYRFNYPDHWTDCHGAQYVRRTSYDLFVGVVLCSSRRYKLYLSETLDGQYSHVADASGRAEDHCEFVGGSEVTARTASYPYKAPKTRGFYRWRWGERPQRGPIGNGPGGRLNSTGRYYVKWYECDVTIPGSSHVLGLNAGDSPSRGRESTGEVPSRRAPAAGGVLAFTIRPTNTTVETGEPVTFECAVNQPGADIAWYFNDDELHTDRSRGIDVDGSVVLIAEVMSRDAGEYACVASSDDKVLESSAFLRVVDFAVVEPQRASQQCKIDFDHVPSDAVVYAGRRHVFRCSPAKCSVDRVTWWRDGSQITTSGRFRVLVNGFLKIRRLTVGDSGVYTCVVRPKIGGDCSDLREVQLTVKLNCGQTAEEAPTRPSRRRGRIVGGTTASRWAAPWQVAIRYRSPPGSLVCGGVLIEHRWVVTTAHCFSELVSSLRPDQPEEAIVDLGERDRSVMETHQVTVGVERIFIHPNFNQSTYDNDIALMQLENRVQFTDYIRPVCLAPQKYQEDHFLHPNRTGTVTGWGRMGPSRSSPLATALQEIHVPYVNESVCSASTTYAVTRNMFCAGYRQGEGHKQDACQGDSGGPLSMRQDGKHYLVGLVSWGEGCGARDKFGFYTKVANYFSWMMKNMRTA